jgi:hypothetical protein
MAPKCSICHHERREEIDKALLADRSIRVVAEEYGAGRSALDRHRRKCLSAQLANAIARHEKITADRLTAWMVGLNEQTLGALARCQASRDWQGFARLLPEARKNLETIARLGGFLDAPVVVDQRQQLAVLSGLTTDELRAIARGESQRNRNGGPDTARDQVPAVIDVPMLERSSGARSVTQTDDDDA